MKGTLNPDNQLNTVLAHHLPIIMFRNVLFFQASPQLQPFFSHKERLLEKIFRHLDNQLCLHIVFKLDFYPILLLYPLEIQASRFSWIFLLYLVMISIKYPLFFLLQIFKSVHLSFLLILILNPLLFWGLQTLVGNSIFIPLLLFLFS